MSIGWLIIGKVDNADKPPSWWERFTAWIYYWTYWFWKLGGPGQ